MMAVPKEILRQLQEIDAWATAPLPALNDNDDFMTLGMELTNHVQFLILVCVSLATNSLQAEQGVTRRKAVVMSHLVRMHKLYDALRYHISRRERDISMIFVRLILKRSIGRNI